MVRERHDNGKHGAGSVLERSIYRGRTIEVHRPAHRAEGTGATKLLIDGQEISIELTELGYLSHDSMFKVFSSPFELAEDLIRQWGDALVRPAHHPDAAHDHGDATHKQRVTPKRQVKRSL